MLTNQFQTFSKNKNNYMRTKRIYIDTYLDCEYDIEFDEILELIETFNEDEIKQIREIIQVPVESVKTPNETMLNKNKKHSNWTKTIYTNKNVECEYDIKFDDILDLIETCNESEIEQISQIIKFESESMLNTNTLYDLQKAKLLKAAEKFTIDELMEKLNMTYLDF